MYQNGKNLYDHLVETLMKVMLDRPGNAYDMFELISAGVKANPLKSESEGSQLLPPSDEEVEKQLKWARACSAILKVR